MPDESLMSDPLSLAPARGRRARTRRQADELLGILTSQIDQGRVRPGERLATERELAAQFGASRSVVRSALAELHKAGRIIRKVGHGTVVTKSTSTAEPQDNSLPLLDTSPLELVEYRLAVEPGLASAMVLHASERDIQAVLDCWNGGEKADGLAEWEYWDRAFHRSLIAATHNRLAIGVYDAIIGIRHEQPWLAAKVGHTDAARWHGYQMEHRRIVDAIVARDAAMLFTAIRDHLISVRAKMLGVG